jgi:ABC-type transport system substrate-binding protein
MKAAAGTPVGAARSKAWAKINHMIADQAPAIPFLWPNSAAVQSKDVVGVLNGYYTTHDLSYTSVK